MNTVVFAPANKIPSAPLYQRGIEGEFHGNVTPVKTGAQRVFKFLDSCFRRNDAGWLGQQPYAEGCRRMSVQSAIYSAFVF
mgnify:CR=1 FL=1